MLKAPLLISIRELHARTGHYVRSARQRKVIITSHGKPSAELIIFKEQKEAVPYFARRQLRAGYRKLLESGALNPRPGDRDVTDLISEDRDERHDLL